MQQSDFEPIPQSVTQIGDPVECFSMTGTPGMSSSSHWHQRGEILFMLRGCYRFIINGTCIVLSEGELLYIPPKQIHTAICPDGETPDLIVLKLDPEIFAFSAPPEEQQICLHSFADACAYRFCAQEVRALEIPYFLQSILKEINMRRAGYHYAIYGLSVTLFAHLYRILLRRNNVQTIHQLSKKDLTAFYAILDYLDQHMEEEIILADLLEICHLSYSNFAVKFRRMTGKNLTDYLCGIRMQKAMHLLATTELSITAIAGQCGFPDLCYFSRIFKRTTGLTANPYRKAVKNHSKPPLQEI